MNGFGGGEGFRRSKYDEAAGEPEVRAGILDLFQKLEAAYSPSEVDQAARHLDNPGDVPEVIEIAAKLRAGLEDLEAELDANEVRQEFQEEVERRAA